ncbi:MAG: GGDEF domain-containing phosphodiesterase [Hyphomonadaceae bacterium]|nr:GGDEF domain-containing phosphodiesterase [Hyphomonadaceae bacterium]
MHARAQMRHVRDIAGMLSRPQTLGAGLLRASLTVVAPVALFTSIAAVFGGPLAITIAAITAGSIGILLAARLQRPLVEAIRELATKAEALGQDSRERPDNELDRMARALDAISARIDTMGRQLRRASYVDSITRLANHERFLLAISGAAQTAEGGAAAVIAFSRLPKLLQSLTPEAANELLRGIAARLIEGARPALVARIGAAEFGLHVPNTTPAEIVKLTHDLMSSLSIPIEWRGHTFALGASCGIALIGKDGGDAQTLLRHARLALESAEMAPSRIAFFTPALDRAVTQRLTLERELRAAIEAGEFRPYFQPKINLANGRIEGCEALARWIRADSTLVSPARFIPVAEETGLIAPLSDAIMSEACWKAAAWARNGRPVKIAVNVSAVQFCDRRFADKVMKCVTAAGLAPSLLELEITESTLMADQEAAVRAIEPLREAGVRFAIDDFGCGHSSLAALAKLPFDVIKIDQQFVRALAHGEPQSGAIVEVILALGKTLGLETVAEGVERIEEAEFMRARGCDWAQGFLFSAAVPAHSFAELLSRQCAADIKDANAA